MSRRSPPSGFTGGPGSDTINGPMIKWWNIFVTPRVLAERTAYPGGTAAVRVRGIVCGRCAQRARQAMDRVAGHRVVRYNPTDGRFEVAHQGALDEAALGRAVQRVVLFRRLRWWLGRPARLLRLAAGLPG